MATKVLNDFAQTVKSVTSGHMIKCFYSALESPGPNEQLASEHALINFDVFEQRNNVANGKWESRDWLITEFKRAVMKHESCDDALSNDAWLTSTGTLDKKGAGIEQN